MRTAVIVLSIALVACGRVPNKAAYAPKTADEIQAAIPALASRFDAACLENLRNIEKTREEVVSLIRIGWTPLLSTLTYTASEPFTDEIVGYATPKFLTAGKHQCYSSLPSIPADQLRDQTLVLFERREIELEPTAASDPIGNYWEWAIVGSSPSTTLVVRKVTNDAGSRALVEINWPG